MSFDPLVFGHRLRHHRRERGWTLDQLGARIGRPAPYLSLLENGKREPKMSQVVALADALGVTTDELLAPEAPNRRSELEIRIQRIQHHPRYRSLGLPELKPSARIPDEALEHVITLFDALTADTPVGSGASLRSAVADCSAWLTEHDGYLPHVERAAADVLASSGYEGTGAVTSRHLNAIAAELGYRVVTVDDIPHHIRSIVSPADRRVFVAQRNALRTRQARKAVLQTFAAHVLGHRDGGTPYELQRNRLEAAYFAAAVLVPETPAVAALRMAKDERDITVEDIKERFYVSYEMAAQRFTNLATRHLDIPTHFIRSDRDGIIWKAYANDGYPLPELGGVTVGRRLCLHSGGRTAYLSDDRFDLHTQFTDTPEGSYWSATHITPDERAHAITTGVRYADARWFRRRRARHHTVSTCPDPSCCRMPAGNLTDAIAAQRMQDHLVTVLSGDIPPAPEPAELVEIMQRRPIDNGSSDPDDAGYPDPWAAVEEDNGRVRRIAEDAG